jgi:hypothetical protein
MVTKCQALGTAKTDWKTLHVRLQIKYLVIAGSVVDVDLDADPGYQTDADPDPQH